MYRTDCYDNWSDAENNGGVYSVPVYSVDMPNDGSGAVIMDDVINAVKVATHMMDGNALFQYRITIVD
jgi:hypothetical protein